MSTLFKCTRHCESLKDHLLSYIKYLTKQAISSVACFLFYKENEMKLKIIILYLLIKVMNVYER
jgi:hypothetical protein